MTKAPTEAGAFSHLSDDLAERSASHSHDSQCKRS
jgi:hypothetical protein